MTQPDSWAGGLAERLRALGVRNPRLASLLRSDFSGYATRLIRDPRMNSEALRAFSELFLESPLEAPVVLRDIDPPPPAAVALGRVSERAHSEDDDEEDDECRPRRLFRRRRAQGRTP